MQGKGGRGENGKSFAATWRGEKEGGWVFVFGEAEGVAPPPPNKKKKRKAGETRSLPCPLPSRKSWGKKGGKGKTIKVPFLAEGEGAGGGDVFSFLENGAFFSGGGKKEGLLVRYEKRDSGEGGGELNKTPGKKGKGEGVFPRRGEFPWEGGKKKSPKKGGKSAKPLREKKRGSPQGKKNLAKKRKSS